MKFLIPILFLLIQLPATAQVDSVNSIKVRKVSDTEAPSPSNEKVYTAVEEMPEFPGGQTALLQYLSSIAYPNIARENDIEGSVFVRFVIDETGQVTNVEIAKGSDSVLNETALNHVRAMPVWEPGRQNGKRVKVQYVVPIKFRLD